MKQLSLTSINSKVPLEVSLTPSGTFSFGTERLPILSPLLKLFVQRY